MGMTDKQFNAFVRLLLDQLREVDSEKDQEKRDEKMKRILNNLQKALED